MVVRLSPLAALLLAASAIGSVGCSSLTEPNDIEIIVAEPKPAAPPPAPAPAPAPAQAPGGRPAAAPAGGG